MAGVASADISTGNAAMISEHQDGKTEPAFKAIGWDFLLGTYGDTDQLRMADNLQSLLDVDSINEARRAGISVESHSPTVPAPSGATSWWRSATMAVREDDAPPTSLRQATYFRSRQPESLTAYKGTVPK